MKWHSRVLPPRALTLIDELSALPLVRSFYLAGGTALALQRGHRVSVDLDFFSARRALDAAERRAFKEKLSRLPGFRVRDEKEGTLHILARGTEVSFLRYRYPLVRRALSWRGLRIASAADIGLMKIGAAIGRGSRKDFRDLREVARAIPLRRLLGLSARKFPDAEDFLFQACKALVYFEEADAEPDVRLLRPEAWASIKTWFEREVPLAFKELSLE